MNTEPLTPKQIAEIEQREAATRPGPWALEDALDGDGYPGHLWVVTTADETPDEAGVVVSVGDRAVGEFIANARQDVPALIAEVSWLAAALADALTRVAELEPPTGVCDHESPYGRRCDLQAGHLGHHQMTGDNSATHSWARS